MGALVAEKDIRRHREVGAEHHLLVDRVDAEADGFQGRGQRDLLPLEQDGACGADMRTGQDLDQRGLSRAILSDDGVDFAGAEREVDLLQGVGAEEALIDLAQLQDRGFGRETVHEASQTFGYSSAWARGLLMFAAVIAVTPVSIDVGTAWPLLALNAISTPS